MSRQCVIVKESEGRRVFWGETGTGLDWLDAPEDVWVYATKAQAQALYRAARLGRQRASIIRYSDLAADSTRKS